MTIIKGPIGVIVGIVYGFIMGGLLWYLPAKDCVRRPKFYYFVFNQVILYLPRYRS